MAITDYMVSDNDIQKNGIQGVVGDSLDGNTEENKKRFDQLCVFLIDNYNKALALIEESIGKTANTSSVNLATAISDLDLRVSRRIDGVDATIIENKKMCDANAELTQRLGSRIDNEMTKAQITYGTSVPSDDFGKDGDIFIQIVG